jgi:hypothetical protein
MPKEGARAWAENLREWLNSIVTSPDENSDLESRAAQEVATALIDKAIIGLREGICQLSVAWMCGATALWIIAQ